MGLPACPSRAGSQNSHPFWWLTCLVLVSTVLDTTIRYLSLYSVYLSCLVLKTSAYTWRWFTHGISRTLLPHGSPFMYLIDWPPPCFSVLAVYELGHSEIRCLLLLQTAMRKEKVKLWLLKSNGLFFLERAVFLRRKLWVSRHHNWSASRSEPIFQTLNYGLPHWYPIRY